MKKIYLKYWFICLVFLAISSCNNDNDETLFPDSPADRIAQSNSELLNLLISQQNGYKGVYFTKNDEFGGFTFFMKFNADGTVLTTSDFDSDTDIIASSFEVRQGTATELVFTTRTHIQKVSNPESDGLIGTGYKGTSVFQYFGTENGKIIFKDIRNRDTASFVLTPTNFNNFESESIVMAEASLAQRQNILPKPTSSVFQILQIENSNGTSNFNLNYNATNLFASPRITLDDGTVTEFNFGIAFTENGLTISPALNFEGQTYIDFSYDIASSSYISTVNGTTAKILFGNQPAFIGRDIENLVDLGPTGFLYRPALGSNPLTSPGHDAMIAQVNANLGAIGFSFVEYQVILDFESDNCDTFLFIRVRRNSDGATFTTFYCYEKAIIENRKLYLNYIAPSGGNGIFLETRLAPIINFFNSNQGIIFTDEGSFSSSTASFSNRAGTFTSIDNPSIRVYGLFFG